MPLVTAYYEGTQLTGTSKDPRKFSNLSNYYHGRRVHYEKNAEYVNVKTGHRYRCVLTAALAKDTEWVYTGTNILKAPGRLATITISKSNDTSLKFTAKLKWVAAGHQSTSNERATSATLSLWVSLKNVRIPVKVLERKLTGSSIGGLTEWTASLSSLSNRLYPKGSSVVVGVYFRIDGSNSKGAATGNASSTYKILAPRVPTITSMEYDADTGEISCKIKSDEGKDSRHRTDTVCEVTTENTKMRSEKATSVTSSSALEITKKYDVLNRALLSNQYYAAMHVRAKCRGVGGDSAWSKERVLYVSAPQNVKIGSGITYENGSVVVPINVRQSSSGFPATGVRLQALVSVAYEKASQIPIGASWSDVGNEDDGQCSALAADVSELTPDAGTFTWIRLKAWNNDEDNHHTYSNPKRLTELETKVPTAADDECTIASVSAGSDGDGVVVQVVWKADDSNKTEVSWSQRDNAWESTEQPETFVMDDATWMKAVSTTVNGVRYNRRATLNVVGLDTEGTYWFSARRMREYDDEATTYGPYSVKKGMMMGYGPTGVAFYSPDYVMQGSPMQVSWEFSGVDKQTKWRLRIPSSTGKTANDIVVTSGNGTSWTCTIPWSVLEKKATNDSISLYVDATTNGGTTSSDIRTTQLIPKPSVAIASLPNASSQPVMMTVLSSTNDADLAIVVRSFGASVDSPGGYRTQAAGDVVWSNLVIPEWAPAEDYPSGSEIEEARERLDLAQSQYNTALQAYESLRIAYANSFVEYNNASAHVTELEDLLADSNMRLTEANGELADAQQRLEDAEPGTEEYESASELVAEATQLVSQIQSTINSTSAELGTESQPGYARRMQSQAEASYNNARTAYENASLSSQEAALEDAYTRYYELESTYMQTLPSDMPYACTLSLPTGLDFIDGASYSVSVVGVAKGTGARSDEVVDTFGINLTHKAPQPPENVSVEPFDVTDEDGFRTIGVMLSLAPSIRTISTDVYDVYRVTQDGAYLISRDLDDEATVIDPYAPFGNAFLRYRVACRTANGDEAWRDYDYYLLGDTSLGKGLLRLDWGSEYLELERSVSNSDSYEKGFEARKHLDGSVSGHWEEGTKRTASLSAALIRGFEASGIESLRRLAQHTGPCMVRTMDGTAYEADVEVGSISPASGSMNVSVSMSATEIDLTDEFMATEVVTQ